ncbi:MAG: Rab family GTPase [Promethearchaeota archaeon]
MSVQKKGMYEELLKICVLGSTEFKTSLIRRFAEGKFTTNYLPTLGVDIITKQIKVNNNEVNLILVDTIGQEFFDKLRPSYFRGASAAIITFEKVDQNSFHAVRDWYRELKKHHPQAAFPIALVGFITNSETIMKGEGMALAEELGLSYYEIKPTDKETIETILHDLVLKVLKCEEENV